MLMVLSQPLFRQRQAVHVVTPTCSSHRERLTTAAPGIGYVLPFDSIFTWHNLPRFRRALVYHSHKLADEMYAADGPRPVFGIEKFNAGRLFINLMLHLTGFMIDRKSCAQ